jgi:hypothetical protein
MPDWKPAIREYLEASDLSGGLERDIEEELSQHLETSKPASCFVRSGPGRC